MFTKKDIWTWLTYDWREGRQTGKLKSYNNDTKTAFIVFKCNNNWDADHWKDYTAESVRYSDILNIDLYSEFQEDE